MSNENSLSFDEQAVLAELERLQAAIRAVRRQREQAVTAFNDFLKTSTGRRDNAASRAVSSSPPHLPAQLPQQPPQVHPPVESFHVVDEYPARRKQLADLFGDTPAQKPIRRVVPWRLVAVAAAAVAILGSSLYFVSTRRGAPRSDAASATQATAAQPKPTNAAPSVSAPAPVVPRAIQIELTALRPVWMRVTVDGQRVLEREVRAMEHVRFGADRAIAVRAGDAGAVRFTRDGADWRPLGGDGQVVSRTFSVEPKGGRE